MHGIPPGVEGSWVYGFINVWVHRFTMLGMIRWALRVVKIGLFSNVIHGGPPDFREQCLDIPDR
jgi:hypothetical protein